MFLSGVGADLHVCPIKMYSTTKQQCFGKQSYFLTSVSPKNNAPPTPTIPPRTAIL